METKIQIKAHTHKGVSSIGYDLPSICTNDLVKYLAQNFFVGMHSISENDFNNWINAYFPNGIPNETILEIEILNTYLALDCDNNHIKWEASNTPTDNTISISPAMGQKEEGKYSLLLFAGIVRLYTPKRIHFYKALRNGTFTVVFKVMDGADVKYHGDLTDLFP